MLLKISGMSGLVSCINVCSLFSFLSFFSFFIFYIFRGVSGVEQHGVSFLHEYDLRWVIGVLVLRYDKRFLICSLSNFIYYSWVLNVL